MTMDELRQISRDVEWSAQERSSGRYVDVEYSLSLSRFRVLTSLARNALARRDDVEGAVVVGIRSLATKLLKQ